MYGYALFLSFFNNLDEATKKLILGNIFLIYDVSIYSIFIRDQSVFFRVFGDDTFYQFVFELEQRQDPYYVQIFSGKKIYNYFIYVDNYFEKDGNYSFDVLTQIFRADDEYQVYCLFQNLL